MVDLQTLGVLVTAVSVTIAAIYYIFTLRINMKTQQLSLKSQEQNLETRQMQLIMELSELPRSKDGARTMLTLANMEWKDYDDFEKKYGSDNNPENYSMRESTTWYFNTMGLLLKHGMVDPELLYDMIGQPIIMFWEKFRDVHLTQRRLYNMPRRALEWEYAYNEMVKLASVRNQPTGYSQTPMKYTEEMRRDVVSGKVTQ